MANVNLTTTYQNSANIQEVKAGTLFSASATNIGTGDIFIKCDHEGIKDIINIESHNIAVELLTGQLYDFESNTTVYILSKADLNIVIKL